jgi:uncharacterized protein (TIGR02996 family)
VTTEDDFNAALDANPADWQTRLIFADWLQERNDPRAEGYRAIGMNRRSPYRVSEDPNVEHFAPLEKYPLMVGWGAGDNGTCAGAPFRTAALPRDWFEAIAFPRFELCDPDDLNDRAKWWRYFHTRRQAEDAAALAFGKLSPKRRAAMLTATPGTKKRKKAARKKPTARKPKGKK